MNERIKQAADLSRSYKTMVVDGILQSVMVIDPERFAELIVQECCEVVEGGSFLHDQAPTAIFARECSHAIKQHFGVK